MNGFPRYCDGKLNKSAIKRIGLVLDSDGLFPELAVVYTENHPIIQPVTKEILDEILESGIEYDERKKKST